MWNKCRKPPVVVLENVIVIRGHGVISVSGHDKPSVFESYWSGIAKFHWDEHVTGALQTGSATLLEQISDENKAFRGVDRSVLMAIYAARQAIETAGWKGDKGVGVNIGSSRGATALFEHAIAEFQVKGTVPASTSPATTLGNISSWVAQDLNASGPLISHSVTCSTGLQAIANGFAWLRSGMADKFLVGASEAPLTPFTLAQMKALGIYSVETDTSYPCRPLNAEQKNTFVLGEGAALFALEKIDRADYKKGLGQIIIESVGFGFEQIKSKTGISKEGLAFKVAMQNAIDKAPDKSPIDLIILHAPGTVAGDAAELVAIESVFKNSEMPVLCSQKWMTGHTLGASACLSLDYAIYILKTQHYLTFPYSALVDTARNRPIKRILINAAGFGGNAAAIIVSCLK